MTGQRINEERDGRSAFQPVDLKVIADARLARPWINPLSLLVLREAISSNATEVILEKRKFTITYEENDKVWLQITTATAPCGRYSKEEILTPGRIFDGL